jgi:hypothetical protein
MSNEIAKRETTPVSATQDWQVMKEQAQVMMKSGFLPPSIRTAEQCVAIFLTGKELGIGFMEAIRSINVIQGKPTVSPQLMLALANRTGELQDQEIDSTDKRAIIKITRKGRKPHTAEFGVKEATDLGLMAKDNYKKQAKTMFVWRALAAALRVTFPDVLLGLYTPEEMGAVVQVDDEGEMKVAQEIPATIIRTQAGELHAAARAKGISNEALLAQLGIARLSDLASDRLDAAKAWLASQPQPVANGDASMKAYDTEIENYIKAGIGLDDLGNYVEGLPFAKELGSVAAHLKILRERNTPAGLIAAVTRKTAVKL